MDLDVIFAWIVGTLAALAVIGVLAFVVVWEWCAIRRTLATHRHGADRPPSDEDFWRQQRALNEPR